MKDISFLDCIIADLKALPADREQLTKTTAPLEREWRRRSISDRERLLAQLDTTDRIIIERIVIEGKRAAALTEETGLTVREIQSAKENALDMLLYLRHGAAYRP